MIWLIRLRLVFLLLLTLRMQVVVVVALKGKGSSVGHGDVFGCGLLSNQRFAAAVSEPPAIHNGSNATSDCATRDGKGDARRVKQCTSDSERGQRVGMEAGLNRLGMKEVRHRAGPCPASRIGGGVYLVGGGRSQWTKPTGQS